MWNRRCSELTVDTQQQHAHQHTRHHQLTRQETTTGAACQPLEPFNNSQLWYHHTISCLCCWTIGATNRRHFKWINFSILRSVRSVTFIIPESSECDYEQGLTPVFCVGARPNKSTSNNWVVINSVGHQACLCLETFYWILLCLLQWLWSVSSPITCWNRGCPAYFTVLVYKLYS